MTPHADDIGFYSFLYPSADYFDTSGTITGTVLAGNGTTPLTGVNVIARNVADPFEESAEAGAVIFPPMPASRPVVRLHATQFFRE